ncbi:MAG: pilus assembly protein [Acidobacteria bacterium]|nr:pilus assembly protein [Acidobacteriota bacterium]MDA1236088.1 pilus assembly protein [Acidobacteriota bacterium]
MLKLINRLKDARRGSIMVEAALVIPLAFMLCVGATDFARLFYHALTVKGASSGAALYGAQELLRSGDISGMASRATADAGNLEAVTATPTQVCKCPTAPPFSCVDYNTTVCAGYGKARAYVRVQVNQDFSTIGRYWNVPNQTNIREASWMLVN